ncbi:uncharacterized protein LOC125437873 [Sphaerodactylus townsendi]|uniref:uncharacterized protein LOC125437873 n=1 Tax=Sphaerodactylus townsendi TaxID=933632 RepID=UPI002025D5E5|nr:uncharacterized protein LOC125437873 [Sphaerodactylus townsendi]
MAQAKGFAGPGLPLSLASPAASCASSAPPHAAPFSPGGVLEKVPLCVLILTAGTSLQRAPEKRSRPRRPAGIRAVSLLANFAQEFLSYLQGERRARSTGLDPLISDTIPTHPKENKAFRVHPPTSLSRNPAGASAGLQQAGRQAGGERLGRVAGAGRPAPRQGPAAATAAAAAAAGEAEETKASRAGLERRRGRQRTQEEQRGADSRGEGTGDRGAAGWGQPKSHVLPNLNPRPAGWDAGWLKLHQRKGTGGLRPQTSRHQHQLVRELHSPMT